MRIVLYEIEICDNIIHMSEQQKITVIPSHGKILSEIGVSVMNGDTIDSTDLIKQILDSKKVERAFEALHQEVNGNVGIILGLEFRIMSAKSKLRKSEDIEELEDANSKIGVIEQLLSNMSENIIQINEVAIYVESVVNNGQPELLTPNTRKYLKAIYTGVEKMVAFAEEKTRLIVEEVPSLQGQLAEKIERLKR